jgi:hypothetical protein
VSVLRQHREDQKMKRKRKIAKVRRKSTKPPDDRWQRFEDRVAALEIIAGVSF